jgi:hypothetical protein
VAKLKRPRTSQEAVLDVPPKALDSALPTDTQPAYWCPCCSASLLSIDVECISRFMTAMTCPACGVRCTIADIINTAKRPTLRLENVQEGGEIRLGLGAPLSITTKAIAEHGLDLWEPVYSQSVTQPVIMD